MQQIEPRTATRRARWTRLAAAALAAHVGTGKAAAADGPAPPVRPNVLLVTLDTTRADHLGCYGARDALTPALDAFAARGVVFDRAYSASPMTLPSHATILTGLEPPEHGLRVNGKSRLAPTVPTLAELLGASGYRTGAFVAAFVLDHRFGLDRGFSPYDDDLTGARPQTVSEHLSVYRPGDRVADAALAWLDDAAGRDAPFFAWVHLYDPHYPDYANEALRGTRFAGVASYDAELAFTDRQVGRLLEFLDERGLRDRTLVVVVADHGEGLGDHDEREHGYLLNEEILRVPLVVALPGVTRAGHRVEAVVSSVDVLPTILDLAGTPNPVHGRGRSLRSALGGADIPSWDSYAETDLPYTVFGWSPLRSLTTPRWHYVRTARPELYDRDTDPVEAANLAGDRTDDATAMDQRLAALERSFGTTAAPDVALGADARQRLEALGYLESAAAAAPATAPSGLRDVKDMLAVKHRGAELAHGLATGAMTPQQGVGIARELVARSPESATFHARLGALLVQAGASDEAAHEFAAAVRLRDDDAESRSNLGHLQLRRGDLDAAAASFRTAIRLRPDLAAAHLGAGLVEMAGGRVAAALPHLAHATRLDPTSADTHLALGNALARSNRPGAAASEYRAALRLRPDFAVAHHDLAMLLGRRDRLAEALYHAREATRLAPDFAPAHDQLGRLLSEDGRLREATTAFATAVRLAPETLEYQDDLAAAYAAAGRVGDAVATARRARDRAVTAGRAGFARDIGRRLAFYERQGRRHGAAHPRS